MEIWLRGNTRALWFGMLLPGLIAVAGLLLVSGLGGNVSSVWVRGLGAAMAGVGLLLVASLLLQIRRPRLAYADGHLLVYLGHAAPERVPIELVEGFLLGQGPSFLPGEKHRRTESTTVVIRLADRAEAWSHIEVKPALGKWCDGYITIRGTWCEPLSVEVVNRLNRRLAEVTRQWQQRKVAGPS